MGHHRDSLGRFQSDKHPLPPDRVRINLENPLSKRGLLLIADDYEAHDAEFAQDLRERVLELHPGKVSSEMKKC